jgi:hypothetical protein
VRRAVAIAALAAAALGGCGGPPADLFLVERNGSIPAARLTLLVSDDGTVRCNRGDAREISSEQLIDAREIARELNGRGDERGPADRDLSLPPASGTIMRYDVRSEDGSVTFSDTSRGQPQAFYRLAKLTRDIARGVCGLPR